MTRMSLQISQNYFPPDFAKKPNVKLNNNMVGKAKNIIMPLVKMCIPLAFWGISTTRLLSPANIIYSNIGTYSSGNGSCGCQISIYELCAVTCQCHSRLRLIISG